MTPVLNVTHIIPTRDRPDMVIGAVESILAGSAVPAELVVVDQSRTPNRAFVPSDVRNGCTIRYIQSRAVGLSRGRNAGIELASNDVLSFTDDDIVVSPDWLMELIPPLLDGPPKTAVTGRVLAGDPEHGDGFAPSTIGEEVGWVAHGRTYRDVLYPNFAIPRSAFVEVGEYDEALGAGTRFPSAEDNDLAYRLLKAGYRIVYLPRAVVVHRAWRVPTQFVPLRWSYGRGQGAFYAKHMPDDRRFMRRRFARDLVSHTGRAARHLVRGRWRRALGDLAYSVGLAVGAVQWSQTIRRAPLRQTEDPPRDLPARP
jgi:GT2 family glycosyltransferase